MGLTFQMQGSRFVVLVLVALLSLAMGCQDSPKDKLREGRAALAAQNADLAEERLNAALKADPKMVEARRLMADVHLLRENYQKAEDDLLALWKELGFDDDGKPTTEQRQQRQLMSNQFNELYRRWAEALDSKENPEKFEEVVRKGLERDGRSTRLNTLLVDFYEQRAERFIEKKQKARAAEELEKIQNLRTFAERRKAAMERAANLRQEAFKEEALARFETELKEELEGAERYDAEKNVILVEAQREVDRRLNPRLDEDKAQALAQAGQVLVPQIAALVVKIGGLPEDTDLSKMRAPKMDIVRDDFRRGQISVVAAVSLDSLIDVGFLLKEDLRSGEGEEKAPEGEEATEEDAQAAATEESKED